jgi:hypothetical protein
MDLPLLSIVSMRSVKATVRVESDVLSKAKQYPCSGVVSPADIDQREQKQSPGMLELEWAILGRYQPPCNVVDLVW